MKNKKLIIIFLFIFVSILVEKILPIKGLIYNSMTKLHITKRCYDRENDFDEIFKQEGIDYEIHDRKVTNDSLKKLLDSKQSLHKDFKIPPITHHIYFTSSINPTELNDFYIEKMKVNFTKLNLHNNWQHFIWTNNPKSIPNEILSIPGVEIKKIEELKNHFLFNKLKNITLKGDEKRPYFAEAADLLRLMAVQTFGGIYNDMDYEIYNPEALISLMKNFDFIGGREMDTIKSFYGNAFISAKANHLILEEALKLNYRNYLKKDTPEYIKYPCKESIRIYYNGPPIITLSYFFKNNINGNKDIILPSWMIFNANFAHYKNKICDYKMISKVEFNENNINLNKLLNNYKSSILIKDKTSNSKENIFYNNQNNNDFPIIGADMFCGNWITGNQFKRNYYWFWQEYKQ